MKLWRQPLDRDQAGPLSRVVILEERCKGCGLCVEYCPRGVLEMSDRFNKKGYHPPDAVLPDRCVGCDFCEEVCPEFAVYCMTLE